MSINSEFHEGEIMTVRELVNYLTQSFVDWEDLEVYICIMDKPAESGNITKWENLKVDRCDLFSPTWYVGDRCQLVFENVSKKNMNKDKIINKLDRLKEDNPEQVIIVETPNGSVDCKIGDANIYEGCNGEIVIDSE